MAGKRQRPTSLPAPFLRGICLLPERMPEGRPHPFDLPWLRDGFALEFTRPVTIIIGENGAGKSTLIEAIAALSGYDAARGGGGPPPELLSHSHGEGFVRFFHERMGRQGIYFMDEPESALLPSRQVDLLRFLSGLQAAGDRQVIMATHSPLLMALPGADLWQVTRHGFDPVDLHQTPHFRLYSDFITDPKSFLAEALAPRPDEGQD